VGAVWSARARREKGQRLSNTMGREWEYKRTGKEKERALARTVVEHSIGFRGALCCFCTVLLNLEPIINPDGEH
jgi:hypothetical protein